MRELPPRDVMKSRSDVQLSDVRLYDIPDIRISRAQLRIMDKIIRKNMKRAGLPVRDLPWHLAALLADDDRRR